MNQAQANRAGGFLAIISGILIFLTVQVPQILGFHGIIDWIQKNPDYNADLVIAQAGIIVVLILYNIAYATIFKE